MKKRSPSVRKRKPLFVAIVVLVVFFLGLFSFQFYLYYNFLIGNDIAVRLDVSREYVALRHGESEDIEVSAKVFTNPFCTAKCDYFFRDVSANESVKEGAFEFNNAEPFLEKFALRAPDKGRGQKVYRFEMTCVSPEAVFCYTGDNPFYQNAVIILDYDLTDEEKELKDEVKTEVQWILANLSFYEQYFTELNSKKENSSLMIDGLAEKIVEVKLAQEEVSIVKKFWEDEEYLQAGNILVRQREERTALIEIFARFENETRRQVEEFNGLVSNFEEIQLEFGRTTALNFSDQSIVLANQSAGVFIEARNSFIELNNLTEKSEFYEKMNISLDIIKELVEEDIGNELERNNSLGEFEEVFVPKIELNESFYLEVYFDEPKRECCLFGECHECCESCSDDESLFPVIFLHGHDFSRDVSAEFSLDVFDEMQRKLESDGLLNFGTKTVNIPDEVQENVWGEVAWPISVKMSYYFDAIRDEGKLNILQAKRDNIDTYSVRLKSIIDTVKKKTGKDKVVLVTHSMGGLVARRYIQIFGEEDVYKLIMIVAPQKGISEGIYGYCATFGEVEECEDMQQGSLLLSRLRNQEFSNVGVFNIVGVGCETEGEDGDGIVQKDNAVLEGARNYFVNGTCSGFNFLHSEIILPNKHPEVYEILREILAG